jgi:predicted short-subunit dehydrogenase-like oxidoreductase (DUF2520 family)
MNVGVIGAGRVGTAVAVLLRRAGHRIVAVSGREATRERAARFLPGVPAIEPAAVAAEGELVLLAVPDDRIPSMARELADASAFRPGEWVLHLSGAAGLDALAPAAAEGARPLALHPLQTFPDVDGALDRIPGCWAAVTAEDEEGFTMGEGLAHDIGANPFRLGEANRPLYHAAAVFASNYLVAASGVAERLFRAAGVPDPVPAMAPLQRATIDNVARLGSERALTGPAVRGDATTIDRNLRSLEERSPEDVAAYVVLCRAALDLAVRSGRLDGERRAAVEEALARWS